MRIDGHAFRLGLLAGPALALGGLLVVLLIGIGLSDPLLLFLVAWPTGGALVFALFPGRRAPGLSMALGSLVGTLLVVAVIIGVITALATMLSDPA